MQDLLDQAAKNTTFSKIDLKSAYHQIPLHLKDMSFTAFEVNGRLFEFTRLPFGVTNAVAASKREMTAFVRRHNLKRTHPYLDDVIIGGRSEEEHQENLKNFLKAAEVQGLTLNKAKCVFGSKTVPMLGHIVGTTQSGLQTTQIRLLLCSQHRNNWPFRSIKLLGWLSQLSRKKLPLPYSGCPGQTSLLFSKPMHPEPVSERHSLKATNLSVSSRELFKHSEMAYSVVEREAIAISEGFRRFSDLLRTSRVLVRTDQKALWSYLDPTFPE